jgi:hypothetical protein
MPSVLVNTVPQRAVSVSAPDLPDSEVKLTPQERPQRGRIAISHLRGHILDAHVARFQQMDRPLDSETLEVRERGFSKHVLHAARESSLAGPHGA